MLLCHLPIIVFRLNILIRIDHVKYFPRNGFVIISVVILALVLIGTKEERNDVLKAAERFSVEAHICGRRQFRKQTTRYAFL